MSREDDVTAEVPVLGVDGKPLVCGSLFGRLMTPEERRDAEVRLQVLDQMRASVVSILAEQERGAALARGWPAQYQGGASVARRILANIDRQAEGEREKLRTGRTR